MYVPVSEVTRGKPFIRAGMMNIKAEQIKKNISLPLSEFCL
jgi:hypothetical protein